MKLFAFAFSFALAFAAAPASATSLPFTISGNGQSGTGTITYGAGDAGGYDVTAISGTLDGQAITGLIGGNPGAGEAYSPSGYFFYDNILFAGQDPLLDLGGLLFGSDGLEVNLFRQDGDYILYFNSGVNEVVSFDLPEPASLGLVAVGLAGLTALRRRKSDGGRFGGSQAV